MSKEKLKAYIYTRISAAMQIDSYSLDAPKSRMKAHEGKGNGGFVPYGYKLKKEWLFINEEEAEAEQKK